EPRATPTTPQLDVEKTFTIIPDSYMVRMVVKAQVKVPDGKVARESLAVSVFGYQNPESSSEGSRQVAARVFVSSSLAEGTIHQTPMKEVFKSARYAANIPWAGFEHPYLLAAFAPKRAETDAIDKHTFALAAEGKPQEPSGLMETDIVFPQVTLAAGTNALSREMIGYL